MLNWKKYYGVSKEKAMGIWALFFSLLFFIAFMVYLFFGIYIIHMNPRQNLNRLFFAVCISLCLWSFGFSMANIAANAENCLFWRRIAAIGWSTVYGFFLHFLLLLTDDKCSGKRLKICYLLYIPSVICFYVFSFSNQIAPGQYSMVYEKYGWVNIGIQNGWDFFFYTYYVSYAIGSLVLLWQWKRKSQNKDVHKQSNMIFTGLIMASLLGSITDVFLNFYLKGILPQMAPLFTLMPVAAIYYSIKRYSLIEITSEDDGQDLILDTSTREKLYYYLSVTYIAGGLLSLLSRFFPQIIGSEEILKSTYFSAGLLFISGFSILLFRFIKKEKLRNFLIFFVILLSIPAITLLFMNTAGETVWAFPVILIIISLVFNSRTLLIMTTIVTIATQIITGIYIPKLTILIDSFTYIVRIGIVFIAFWIGSIVNRIYIKRLNENIQQVHFQKLVSDISFDFVNVGQDNFNEKINNMLTVAGKFFEVDRSYLFLVNTTDNTLTFTNEWSAEGIDSKMGTLINIPPGVFPWWMKQLEKNKLIYIEDVNKLPKEAAEEKADLSAKGIKSVIVVPLEENEKLLGFIGFNAINNHKKWNYDHIKLLKVLANIVAHGLIKVKAEKEIEYMAYYDNLTGLPNKTLFIDRLQQSIQLAKRNIRFISVIYIDLDNFKMLNDSIGHSGGDLLIKKISNELSVNLRKIDTVARFSGDEFLIMINNIEMIKDVKKVVYNVMEVFKHPFNLNNQEFFITASAGVAVYPMDGEDPDTIIKNADIAMYKAKSRGKNQYVLCTPSMKEEVKQNMVLSNNLYRALERGELSLLYQPQIQLSTGQIIGMEALLRWNHPELGFVPPNIFIPLAERNGLIHSIGEWVLKTACSQNKKWQDMGLHPLRMGVNLSVMQFKDPRILDSIGNILKETGLEPKYLELEITESIAASEANQTIDILTKLKKIGVSISIDDFGTEYSSLNRLKMLPIDRIKIDMQFIQGIESSEKDQAITNVIINLAKSLELEVLAEGVETEVQKDFLIEKNCDDVQGFYYYKPMSAKDLEHLLDY